MSENAGEYEAAHKWAHAVADNSAPAGFPWLQAQACWLSARCMLVIGGPSSHFQDLIKSGAEAELQCSCQGSTEDLAMGLQGLAVDQALCCLAEGRVDVIEFFGMVKESEQRKGFRLANVPAQPKFYGKPVAPL